MSINFNSEITEAQAEFLSELLGDVKTVNGIKFILKENGWVKLNA